MRGKIYHQTLIIIAGIFSIFSASFAQAAVEPVITQSSFRWFDALGSTSVGPPLSDANQPTQIYQLNNPFRLRLLLKFDRAGVPIGSQDYFKLQYAERVESCDVNFVGELYKDIKEDSPLFFFDINGAENPKDGERLVSNIKDPQTDNISNTAQSYEESNPFSGNGISAGGVGLWDFSLAARVNKPTSFCVRVVRDNGSLLERYSVIPEIIVGSLLLTKAPADNFEEDLKKQVSEIDADINQLSKKGDGNAKKIGGNSKIVIVPSESLPALGNFNSSDEKQRWSVAADVVETNTLIGRGTAIFEDLVWFKGDVFRFGDNTITFNTLENRAIFGRNPNSGIVFGDGDNTSFSFLDANDNADLVGRKELVKIIDSGDSADLHVTGGAIFNQDGTPTEFRVQGATNPNLFVINPTTEITTVSGRLDVGRAIVANSDNSRGMTFFRYSNVVGESSFISFRRHRGTFSTPTAVQQNDFLGKFDFQGYDGAARQTSAIFSAVVDGPVSPGKVPTGFIISTGSNSANLPVRLRVTSQGLVGINTSDPTHTLTVAGDIRILGQLLCDDCSVSGPGGGSLLAVSSFSPADDSIGVLTDANLVVNFSKEIKKNSSGAITIYDGDTNSVFENMTIGNPNITINSNQLIINPVQNFLSNKKYFVTIQLDSISDLNNNNFIGFTESDIWNFTAQ